MFFKKCRRRIQFSVNSSAREALLGLPEKLKRIIMVVLRVVGIRELLSDDDNYRAIIQSSNSEFARTRAFRTFGEWDSDLDFFCFPICIQPFLVAISLRISRTRQLGVNGLPLGVLNILRLEFGISNNF